MVILHASAYCMVVHIFTGRVWTYADLTQAAKALEFESRFFALVFASKQVSIIFDIIKICFFRSFDLWHCNITAPRARGRPGLGRFSPNKSKLLPLFPLQFRQQFLSENHFFLRYLWALLRNFRYLATIFFRTICPGNLKSCSDVSRGSQNREK